MMEILGYEKAQKKKLLIVIDNLSRGGAEVLLVGILKDISNYFDIILVTLTKDCGFESKDIIFKYRFILNSGSRISFFYSIKRLRKIIRTHRPDIIHSHLFYSSLVSRLSCPSKIPLIYTIHNDMSRYIFDRSRVLQLVEKLTIRKNHTLMAVSESILFNYEKTISKINGSFVLRNYVSDDYFKIVKNRQFENLSLHLIAVGNIKDQKNYTYLVEAFKLIKHLKISLDIYGVGKKTDIMLFEKDISENDLMIHFKGSINTPFNVLPKYDLFVSSSKYEGFGLAPVEAMAMGLPLLLSDIPVFHEITNENALFFDIGNPVSFAQLIEEIHDRKHDLRTYSSRGIAISRNYSKEIYFQELLKSYNRVLDT